MEGGAKMLSLKFILDTLNNHFSDNRIIEKQCYTDAVITDGRITAEGVDSIFPVNCYIMIENSVFNNKVFKVSSSGTDYIEATGIVEDIRTEFNVKACLIPDEVVSFSEVEHIIPSLDSENIGNYSYSTTTPGVKGFIRSKLTPYYNGVRI